jgi:predicted membrane channel-forming protein YqfA (hemolysin III family)
MLFFSFEKLFFQIFNIFTILLSLKKKKSFKLLSNLVYVLQGVASTTSVEQLINFEAFM